MSGMMQPPGGPMPPGPQQPPPGMKLNPAFAQWMQQAQEVQKIQAENARRQAEFQAAVELIRKDGITGFRLDIETDSTIASDEQAEKQARIEFMQQFIPLLQNVVPVAQGNPDLAELAKEATLFAVRGFQVARTLEESIEKAFDAIGKMPPNPKVSGQQDKGSHQNPAIEAAKVQADVQDTHIKAQADMAAVQQRQQEAVLKAQTDAAKVQVEREKAQANTAVQLAELQQRDRHAEAQRQHEAAQNVGRLV